MCVLAGAVSSYSALCPPQAPNHVRGFIDKEGLVFGGRVDAPPRVTADRTRIIVDVDEATYPDRTGCAVSGKVMVTTPGFKHGINEGDRILFPAVLREINTFRNPGAFDYQRYMAGQGVWASAFLKSSRLIMPALKKGESASPGFISGVRSKASILMDRSVGQPARGLVKALLLGVQDELEPDLRDVFRKLGLAHLLAVSGLHIGLVALLSYKLIQRIILRFFTGLALRFNIRRLCALLSLGPVLFYAMLAGGRPSTVRAATMVCIFLLAALIERRKDSLTALAAAAWIILIMQPAAVFQASFQLSFAAAGALIILVPRFPGSPFKVWKDDGKKARLWLLSKIWGLAIVSITALIGTLPIAIYHFNSIPLLSLPANIVFTPLISAFVVPPGLIALAAGLVWPWLGSIMLQGIQFALWFFLPSIEAAAALPGINPVAPKPGLIIIFSFYILTLIIFFIRPLKKAAAASAVVVLVCGLSFIVPFLIEASDPVLRVTILDVGQGNSAHISMPDGTDMVIDGGGFPGSEFDTGEKVVGPYLLARGLTGVDILVMTHPDIDHSGGLPYLAKTFRPKELWSNSCPPMDPHHRSLLSIAQCMKIMQPGLEALHRARLFGSIKVRALGPPVERFKDGKMLPHTGSDNNNSLVLKIEFEGVSFLFPGDIEAEAELELVRNRHDDLKSTVLLASHHGSAGSMTAEFLEAVRPRIVVFSAGRNNRFGFPTGKALDNTRRIGARIYRTDVHGATTFITDGKELDVRTEAGR